MLNLKKSKNMKHIKEFYEFDDTNKKENPAILLKIDYHKKDDKYHLFNPTYVLYDKNYMGSSENNLLRLIVDKKDKTPQHKNLFRLSDELRKSFYNVINYDKHDILPNQEILKNIIKYLSSEYDYRPLPYGDDLIYHRFVFNDEKEIKKFLSDVRSIIIDY